jgi:hypothetical protein
MLTSLQFKQKREKPFGSKRQAGLTILVARGQISTGKIFCYFIDLVILDMNGVVMN